jgi:hypothetical protein
MIENHKQKEVVSKEGHNEMNQETPSNPERQPVVSDVNLLEADLSYNMLNVSVGHDNSPYSSSTH